MGHFPSRSDYNGTFCRWVEALRNPPVRAQSAFVELFEFKAYFSEFRETLTRRVSEGSGPNALAGRFPRSRFTRQVSVLTNLTSTELFQMSLSARLPFAKIRLTSPYSW
jgi:hypothetical protein